MNTMRKAIILSLCITISIIMSGCAKKSEPKATVKELADLVKAQISKDYELPEAENFAWDEVDLTSTDGKELLDIMELDPNTMEEAVYLNDPVMISANRIVIAKAKSDKDIEAITSGFKKLNEAHKAEWEQYLPDQLEQVKHAVIETNGTYIMYIVYKEPSVIKKIIDDKILEEK